MSKTRRTKQVPKRKEPASVTIGNLQRDVHNLTQRCAELAKRRDEYMTDRDRMQGQRDAANQELAAERRNHYHTNSMLQDCQAKLASTEQRFNGYRQAIEDLGRPPRTASGGGSLVSMRDIFKPPR